MFHMNTNVLSSGCRKCRCVFQTTCVHPASHPLNYPILNGLAKETLGHDTNAFVLLLTSMELAKSHTCTRQIPVGNECECTCTRFPQVQVQVYSHAMLLNVKNITQTLIYSRFV